VTPAALVTSLRGLWIDAAKWPALIGAIVSGSLAAMLFVPVVMRWFL
jgi:uncharacterized protein (DUF2062 family)